VKVGAAKDSVAVFPFSQLAATLETVGMRAEGTLNAT
jgi:hypothetical protein